MQTNSNKSHVLSSYCHLATRKLGRNFGSLKQYKLATISVTLLFIALTGCQGQATIKNDLATYQSRLAHVLHLNTPSLQQSMQDSPAISLAFPTKASLRQDAKPMSMNLRDFYALDGCSVKTLIAQRNTALGKVAQPSVHYSYELNLLEKLAQCVGDTPTDSSAVMLKEVLSQKQQDLPIHWANMLTQSDEVYRALSQSAQFVSGNSEDAIQAALLDLKYLLNVLPTQGKTLTSTSTQDLETHMQSVYQHQFYAKLWHSKAYLSEALRTINSQITPAFSTLRCNTPSAKQDLSILRNVFSLFFIQNIQALASRINDYHYQLSPLFDQLMQHPALPQEFVDAIHYRQVTLEQAYKAAMQEHISLWQSLFKRCDISPQSLKASA